MAWVDEITLPYARVTGHFGAVLEDRADAGLFPDIIPVKGKITLTPSVTLAKINGALMSVRPVTAKVYNGVITNESGDEGIYILATDGLDNVSNWGWTAKFEIDGMKIDPISFYAITNSEIDLVDLLEGVSGEIIETVVGPPGPAGPTGPGIKELRNVGYGLAEAVLDNGTVVGPISLPPGPEGGSIVGGRDNGNGTMSFILSSGGETDPVVIPTGPAGIKGDKGVSGDKGDTGPIGPVGPEGPQGIPGIQGTPGDAGPTGPQGDQGPTGETGPNGPVGPAGAPGAVPTSNDYLIIGPGRPDIPATTGSLITGNEPVGAEYVSSVGGSDSLGARRWEKVSTTSWVCTQGRCSRIVRLSGFGGNSSDYVRITRHPTHVEMYGYIVPTSTIATRTVIGVVPSTMQPAGGVTKIASLIADDRAESVSITNERDSIVLTVTNLGMLQFAGGVGSGIFAPTTSSWPTSVSIGTPE